MAPTKNRSGANKLNQALTQYHEQVSTSSYEPLKLALKILRENFGEDLKITSISEHSDSFLTQTIKIILSEGKFEKLLAEQSFSARLDTLHDIDPNALPNRTLNELVKKDALTLLGFDLSDSIKVSNIEKKDSKNDDESQTLLDKAESYPSSLERNEIQQRTIQDDEAQTDSTDEGIAQSVSTNTEIPEPSSPKEQEGVSVQLKQLIQEKQIIESEEDSDDDKKVSTDIIGKILEYMRDLDLSEGAILSRLRSTTAKSIHDLTQKEGYRITGWLKPSKIDSVDIVKKRAKFGGFNDSINNKAPSDAAKPSPQGKSTNKDLSDSKNTGLAVKALEAYKNELKNHENAQILAIAAIKVITNQDVNEENIEDTILRLNDAQAKKFRTTLAGYILTGDV